jgi:hypothetical protein
MVVKLAVDIDNVTLAWQDHWIEQYSLWFDREVPADQQAAWAGFYDGTHFERPELFWAWMDEARVWWSLPPVPGALGALWTLKTAGHHLEFVTARPPGDGQRSAETFASGHLESAPHRLFVPIRFLNGTSKHLAKCDLWIDDSPEVLSNLMEHNKKCIRFARPWNESAPSTHTATDWWQVLAIIEELA